MYLQKYLLNFVKYVCKSWVVKGKVEEGPLILFKSLKTQVTILGRENLIFLSFKCIIGF